MTQINLTYTYIVAESEHLGSFGIINMNGRIFDPNTATFFSPDPFVQAPFNSQNFNRYSYCLNNPLMYTDPSGEFFFSMLAAMFCPPLVIPALFVDFFTDVGFQAQKLVSPVAFQIDLKLGTNQMGLGFNIGVGVPKLASPVAPWIEGGATYYWNTYGGYQGWEFRLGVETTFFGCVTVGSTQYWAGESSQTVGHLKLRIPGSLDGVPINGLFGLDIYNDMTVLGVGGDGGDRYRTSRVRLSYLEGLFYAENILFTGDPGLRWEDRWIDDSKGPYGTYRKNPYGPDPNKYRNGILSIGVGPISMGYDSERIRAGIQNWIHDRVGSPYFEYMPNKKSKFYFQFGGGW